jgi:CHAT domain-containing protein
MVRFSYKMRQVAYLSVIVATAPFPVSTPSIAATYEQLVANCRQSVMPQFMKCMQGKRGAGDRESNVAACKAPLVSVVKACVGRESEKAAAGKAAPEAPKAEAPVRSNAGVVAPSNFVAPPRTIADITAILDTEKPDAKKINERKAVADAAVPQASSPRDLVQFYYDRGTARALLARSKDALADGLKALEVGGATIDRLQLSRVRQFLVLQYGAVGDPKKAIALLNDVVRDGEQRGNRGTFINAAAAMVRALVSVGDVTQADAYARRVTARVQEARGSPLPTWRKAYPVYGNSWESDADGARGAIFEARGQFREAEDAYARAESFRRASLKNLADFDYPPPPEQIVLAGDTVLMALARVKSKQGRLGEAESDVRRALLSQLKNQGKYNPQTPKFIEGLASVLVEQGRLSEAEKLFRSSLEVQQTLGIAEDSPATASSLSQLGNVLTLQHKVKEAAAVYARLDKSIEHWEDRRRELFLFNGSRIASLYDSGQLAEGITAAQELVKRKTARFGENHFEVASARATLAVGYAKAGRVSDAISAFKTAIPILTVAAKENADDDDTTTVAARSQLLRTVAESYIGLLSLNNASLNEAATETFALADLVRGRSVQQALAASSARALAKDPALAELVRKEQDLGKQINAQLGTLNNALTLPSSERDDAGVKALSASIEKLRAERSKAKQEIVRQFPSYADLVDPKSPSVAEIRATLRSGEALLSFYFGDDASFVWAVPKDGDLAFGAVKITSTELEGKVRKLREALEPQAAMVSDIPAFDLKLAYEIYGLLLKPVEPGWKSSERLIVVTNGALGLLPLSLLPTAASEIQDTGGPTFSGYRDVPWLIRTHAITTVPSAAALKTLRQMPAGSSKRDPIIGFGDPIFSNEQLARTSENSSDTPTVVADLTTRGVKLKRRSSPQLEGVDSADLAMLPGLPDTAEELKSIALALEADPAKVLNLGLKANEKVVKTTDLSKYKIVVFATHGLVAGDLNGLTQPALALSAPGIAGVDGDGVLTMEEILELKLDADWVVLSACNTGAGAGAGAEAASGLGRAFFYAGTRALLVTNWSVHSESARELTTDLFHRQATEPKLGRSEALRDAMLALIDGKGFVDEKGKTIFAYAHPLFWAPYTIIGDGG